MQGGKQSPGVLLEEATPADGGSLPGDGFCGSRWQVSALSKKWRCSAHVQAPACSEDRSSLAFAASQQGWHRSLRGPGQMPSSQPLEAGKSPLRSCWAPLPNLHPGENLKDLSPSFPGSTLPVSPQKLDPRPGKRCRILCRGLRSPGCWQAAFLPFPACHPRGADSSQGAGPAKEGSGCVFEALAGRIIAQIASEFLLPWAPGGKQPLGSRSALARAALQHRMCASAELQRVLSRFFFQNWGFHQHRAPATNGPCPLCRRSHQLPSCSMRNTVHS